MKDIKQQWADKLIGSGKQICYFDPSATMIMTENGYEWPFDLKPGNAANLSISTRFVGEVQGQYRSLAYDMKDAEMFTLNITNAQFHRCGLFGDIYCLEIGDLVFLSTDIEKELFTAQKKHEALQSIASETAKVLAFDINAIIYSDN